MIKKSFSWLFFLVIMSDVSIGQDTSRYELRLNLPVLDLPQNISMPYFIPSMDQSFELSYDFYELSFFGIDKLGDRIFVSKTKAYSKGRRISNNIFKYGLGLVFSKYASELPIPLGVWAHEEYHRSVLAAKDISSVNGNWLFNRWDGTVYGISDETLSQTKSDELNQLLYSYVAGVQYEIALNEKVSIRDFYKKRSLPKNALLLYNAYYVYDYFRFSSGALSDSVKILAPPNESKDPVERDYAGADLTAWVYDMFNPSLPYTSRDPFPDGEGVNRRIGFSDLSPEAQSYLEKQKKLSLLNFVNPAIFFVNRIKISNSFSFNMFTQYSPTHFGNDIALFIPFKYKNYDLLLNVHNYSNRNSNGMGLGIGLFNYRLTEKIESDITINAWNQPETFFDNEKLFGGSMGIESRYFFRDNFAAYILVSGKSDGWEMGNPYLHGNLSFQMGVNYNLVR